MAKSKEKAAFYAVKAGRRPDIYSTWEACKAQVHGFKGALFKKFETLEQAQAFMDAPALKSAGPAAGLRGKTGQGSDEMSDKRSKGRPGQRLDGEPGQRPAGISGSKKTAGMSGGNKKAELLLNFDPEKIEGGHFHAFVDGSYNQKEEKYGFGLVLFSKAGKETFFGSEKGAGAKHRNVAGELLGAQAAMEKALERKAKKLTIYHDYSGLRHWALGEWKTNLPITRSYADFSREFQKKCLLDFVKVPAHSGVEYNEEADKLAKKGAGLL